MLRSLLMAFSMYSRIPVPHTGWKEEDMKYVLALFPFVGLVIAGAEYIWSGLGYAAGLSAVFMSAVSVAIPVFISGGIHLDGFIDTSDALASYRTSEERLRILKDPHIGAFAVIRVITLLIITFGAVHELFYIRDTALYCIYCLVFVLSRVMSAASAVLFRSAGNKGTLEAFGRAAEKKPVVIMLAVEYIVTAVVMLYVMPTAGILVIVTSAAVMTAYRFISERAFGGVTGDTSGWFLCVNECASTLCLAMAAHLL